jgi:hypothetical protein
LGSFTSCQANLPLVPLTQPLPPGERRKKNRRFRRRQQKELDLIIELGSLMRPGFNIGKILKKRVPDQNALDPLTVVEILGGNDRRVPGKGGRNDESIPKGYMVSFLYFSSLKHSCPKTVLRM